MGRNKKANREGFLRKVVYQILIVIILEFYIRLLRDSQESIKVKF
jgi:hypothetical protein